MSFDFEFCNCRTKFNFWIKPSPLPKPIKGMFQSICKTHQIRALLSLFPFFASVQLIVLCLKSVHCSSETDVFSSLIPLLYLGRQAFQSNSSTGIEWTYVKKTVITHASILVVVCRPCCYFQFSWCLHSLKFKFRLFDHYHFCNFNYNCYIWYFFLSFVFHFTNTL